MFLFSCHEKNILNVWDTLYVTKVPQKFTAISVILKHSFIILKTGYNFVNLYAALRIQIRSEPKYFS